MTWWTGPWVTGLVGYQIQPALPLEKKTVWLAQGEISGHKSKSRVSYVVIKLHPSHFYVTVTDSGQHLFELADTDVIAIRFFVYHQKAEN